LNNLFSSWIRIFIFTNVYLGLLAVALVQTSEIYFQFQVTETFYSFVFISTLLVYNVDRLISINTDFLSVPGRTSFVHRYRLLIILLIVLLSGIELYLVTFFSERLIFASLFLLLMVLFYLSIYGFRRKFNSPFYSFMKPFLIGFVWAFVVIYLPFFSGDESIEFKNTAIILFVYRAILYICNALFFDMRDVKSDSVSNQANIALHTGFRKTQKLINILLFFAFLILVVCVLYFPLWNVVVGESLVLLIYFIYNQRFAQNYTVFSSEMIYPVFIDGVLFLPFLWTAFVQAAEYDGMFF